MFTGAMMPTTHSNPDQLDRLITQLDSGMFSELPRAASCWPLSAMRSSKRLLRAPGGSAPDR